MTMLFLKLALLSLSLNAFVGCGDTAKEKQASNSTNVGPSTLEGKINSDGFLSLDVSGFKYPKSCTKTQDENNSVRFEYNLSSGKIASIVRTKKVAGSQSVKTYQLSYDSDGRFTGYTSDGDLVSGQDTVTITYTAEGLVKSFYDPVRQLTDIFTFDNLGSLTKIENSSGYLLYDWNLNTESKFGSSGSKSFERKYYTMFQAQKGIEFGPVEIGKIPKIVQFGQLESSLTGEKVFSCSKNESIVECESGNKGTDAYILDRRQLIEISYDSGSRVRKANNLIWTSSSTSSAFLYNAQGQPIKQEYQSSAAINTWEYDSSGVNLLSSSGAEGKTVCAY